MKKIIIATLAFVAMVGCTKTEEINNDSELKVSFASSIATKTSGTEWESDDVVGIIVTGENAALENYKYNAKYTVDISSSTYTCSFDAATAEDAIYYSTDEAVTLDFYAYYPYSEDVDIATETYPINVAEQADPASIDFMEASTRETTPEGYNKNSDDVSLNFTRRMSQIYFTIASGDGYDISDLKSITLEGFYSTADYDLANNEFTNFGNIQDITPYSLGNDTYSAIIIPTHESASEQIYAPVEHKIVFTASDGKRMEWVLTDANFYSGYSHSYSVYVQNVPVIFGGAEVLPWGEDATNPEIEAN